MFNVSAAPAGASPARKQHRVASGACSVGVVIFGPAGPQQESPPHAGSLVPQTTCQPAGAPCHR